MKPDVLGRLDALAGRRRSFVATGAAGAEPARAEDDDLPLLTEVVDIAEVSGDQPHNRSPGLSEPLLEAMAAELSNAVQQRLTADFPALLDDAVERLAGELRRGMHQITETAVRDYLARRRQLSLPLEAPPPPEEPA